MGGIGMSEDLNPDPTSTYGATAEYRAAWDAKYGDGKLLKSDLVERAVASGQYDEKSAKAESKDHLMELFGGPAPSATSDSIPGQGHGTSAENTAVGDPDFTV